MSAPEWDIWGLCAKCGQWFDCRGWFDRSVPTPCCPTCALGPAAITYARPRDAPGERRLVGSESWIG